MQVDDVYTESFFKARREDNHEEKAGVSFAEAPVVEDYEITGQMLYYLDQLEIGMAEELKDPSDFRFIFGRIRDQLKEKSREGVSEMLDELEELLDIKIII